MKRADSTIDAVVALLRMRSALSSCCPKHGQPACTDLDIGGIDWRKLISFASAHFVLQALAEPLMAIDDSGEIAPDALAFLQAFAEENAARNVKLRQTLVEISSALNESGIVPVALKGGAFLLDSHDDAASWRFMGDLDLLVPEDRLGDGVEVLNRLGFIASPTDTFDPSVEAHFPPLISPCQTFSVELHTRLFGLDDFDICPGDVRTGAKPSALRGVDLHVPSIEHRFAHLLAHAQLHNRNFISKRLVLKDLLDISMLRRQNDNASDFCSILATFKTPENKSAVEPLLMAWERIMGKDQIDGLQSLGTTWADKSIARLYWNRWVRRLHMPGDFIFLEIHRLARERGHLKRRFGQLSDPALALNVSRVWWSKQRQRHWA